MKKNHFFLRITVADTCRLKLDDFLVEAIVLILFCNVGVDDDDDDEDDEEANDAVVDD